MGLSLAAAVPLLLLPGSVLSIFGPGFHSGGEALQLLTVANLVNAFAAFNGLLLMMTGHARKAAGAAASALTLNVALSIALVPIWGAAGAATAALASVALRNALNSWQTRRLLNLDSTVLGRRLSAP
jgi:O-antigen/teichoic acid export membrane protein